MKKIILIFCIVFVSLTSALQVLADEDNQAVNQSSTSVFFSFNSPALVNLEISETLNDYLGMRVNIGVKQSLSYTQTFNKNTVSGTLKLDQNSLLLDYRPFAGSFFLSGGLTQQNYRTTFKGSSTETFTANNTTYQVNDIGSLNGSAEFDKKTAPYLGFGWTNRYNNQPGIAYGLEIGVFDVGAVDIAFAVTCGSSLSTSRCTQLKQDVAKENKNVVNDVNKSLKRAGFNSVLVPVISFGMGYSF